MQTAILNLNFEKGIPSDDFLGQVWYEEPLIKTLRDPDLHSTIPGPDLDISLIAKNTFGEVIGQCSANRVVKYWTHIETLDIAGKNASTQALIQIQKKAVEIEKTYLKSIYAAEDQSFHSAGIGVLPAYRGKNVSIELRQQQIAICRENKATTLFVETSNRFSVPSVEKFGFEKVAEFPYADLATELNYPDLNQLKGDSFTVWCLNLKA